jgi:sRNA-binding protein
LRIGIHRDIRAAMPELPVALLKMAFRRWVRSPRYLQALSQGGARFDCLGNQRARSARLFESWRR